MQDKNPKLVVDQILDAKPDRENVVGIYPMTIRRYALLEKIESPFVGFPGDFNVQNTIPACYILCSSKDTLKKYSSCDRDKLVQDAFDWSEDLELDDLPKMVDALVEQLKQMNKAAPDGVGQGADKKKE